MAFATLAEFKAALNYTGDTDDVELENVLEAADREVAWRAGETSSATTTETIWPTSGVLLLSRRPVTALTSVTPYMGTALDVANLEWTAAGEVYRLDRYTLTRTRYTVVYVGGHPTIPAGLKRAGLIIAQHLWTTQTGLGGLRQALGGDALATVPGSGFAVPYQAENLLRQYRPFGRADDPVIG